MNTQKYAVSLLTPEEADQFIRQMRGGPENRSATRTMVLPGGFEISGEYFLTARDAVSGEVEWEHQEKNLITDLGRRSWMISHWHMCGINFCPSIEAPVSSRYGISTDYLQMVGSGNIAPTITIPTHTKTFSTTFTTPAITRTLGMISLSSWGFYGTVTLIGLSGINSYALLTPPKTQTTTQTLEVVYKVSMNPID